MSVTEEAYQKSIALLTKLVTPHGFIASDTKSANYKRVWARDGVIAGIAGLHTGDVALIRAFRKTLETLSMYQDDTGRIPSNVNMEDEEVVYGLSVGRVDATIWFVLGVALYVEHTKDASVELIESAERALFYLACLELNGRGFLYVPQGGDWADEYINHGYVLYDEALYALALIHFGRAINNLEIEQKGLGVRELIDTNFYPKSAIAEEKRVYHKPVYDWCFSQWRGGLPIAYFTNHSAGLHKDFWASALFVLLGVGGENKHSAQVASALHAEVVRAPCGVVAAFDPVITEKDTHHWEHLQKNFLFEFKNKPHHFHNGGRWPVVHGFVLTALEGNELRLLDKFAQVLKETKYAFPEYLHGETCVAGGVTNHAFSASGYILAYANHILDRNYFRVK